MALHGSSERRSEAQSERGDRHQDNGAAKQKKMQAPHAMHGYSSCEPKQEKLTE